MRIAVGGGRGFVGARVVSALAAVGHEVVPFGREGLGGGDAAVEALVWAGGRREADEALMDVQHVRAPVAALLRAAEAGRLRRVVYFSSAEVYGPTAVPFREQQEVAPKSAYAVAKRRAEVVLGEVCKQRGVELVVLRPGVIYGPGQPPRMLIPAAALALRAGKRFELSGDGSQTRDFVHVDDVAAAVVAAVTGLAGTYNVGTGVETAARDAVRLLARLIGADESLVVTGVRPHRPDEQLRYVLDPTLAAAELGWRAQTPLERGLSSLTPR